jgi:hypothetical protein
MDFGSVAGLAGATVGLGDVAASPEELARRVAASGVPVHVEGALAVAGIAALLRAPADRSRAQAPRA